MRAFLYKLNCICHNRVFQKVGSRSKVTGRLVPEAVIELINVNLETESFYTDLNNSIQ